MLFAAVPLFALSGAVSAGPPAPASRLAPGRSPIVYVSDYAGNLVDVFDGVGRRVGEISKGLKAPVGLFVDGRRNLWVANGGANDVLVFALGSTSPSETLSDPNGPNDVTLCPDGTAYVADSAGEGGVGVYPPGHLKPTRRLEPELSGSNGIELYITCDAAGNVFATGLIGLSPIYATSAWMGGKQSGYLLLPGNGLPLAGIQATSSGTLLISTYNGSAPAVVEYTEAGQPTGRAIDTGTSFWAGIALNRADDVVLGAVPDLRIGESLGFPDGRRRHEYKNSNLQLPEGIAFDQG